MQRECSSTENSKIMDIITAINERIKNAENERDSALLEASYLQSLLKSQISTIYTGSLQENSVNGIGDIGTHTSHQNIFRQIENEALDSLESSVKHNNANSTTHDSKVVIENKSKLFNKPKNQSKGKEDDTVSSLTNNPIENKQNKSLDSCKIYEGFKTQNTRNINQLMCSEPIFDSDQSTELRRCQTETPIHQINGCTRQSDNFQIFPNKLNILENSVKSKKLSPTLFTNGDLCSGDKNNFLPDQIPNHIDEINPIHRLDSYTICPQSTHSLNYTIQDNNEQTDTICQCRLAKLLNKLQILTNQCRNHLRNCSCRCNNTKMLCKSCSLTGNIESHQHANAMEVKHPKVSVKTVSKVSTTKPSWKRHVSVQSKNKEISVSPRLPKYRSPLINKFNSCEPKITKDPTSKPNKNTTLNSHFPDHESAQVFIPVEENISFKHDKSCSTESHLRNHAYHIWPGVEVITTVKPLSSHSSLLKSKLESDSKIETDVKKKIVSHYKPVLYTVLDNSEPIKLNKVSWKRHT